MLEAVFLIYSFIFIIISFVHRLNQFYTSVADAKKNNKDLAALSTAVNRRRRDCDEYSCSQLIDLAVSNKTGSENEGNQ